MAVPSAYLTSTKNTKKIFASMQKASVPTTSGFTYEFLKQLGYASSSDRPMIPVLKAIGFLDASGKPTDLYRQYKDPAIAKQALAIGLRAGYADLFAIDNDAYKRNQQELAGMFARLTDKGESVTGKMAMTFRELASMADFAPRQVPAEVQERKAEDADDLAQNEEEQKQIESAGERREQGGGFSLRHDVHVHLPLSTDVAVYDAIFKSLRENLM